MNKKNICDYCGGGIFFEEDPKKPRKPDGMMSWTCYNLDTNTVHDCPHAPWKKKTYFSEADMWKKVYELPVYCYSCSCYYSQSLLCTHLEVTGFRPGIDLPGNWHSKYISSEKKNKNKKNSTTLYNREEFQENLDLIL